MTRNEMIRLRRQMQRRIQDVVAERRQAANQRATGASEKETSTVKVG
ncbi:hypothetical protein [Phytohabitans suffuscus]|uniref:Uncharacterized protein n=1 Tax=Phytohabitans suffuscus TaxID=624315 RepID=A0A6F8YGF4_9ACTN|nr:hypothetical protein [Phytohabitans suffuscus]BCB85147.1 hypothetical protein Psuf_024600 [Phytohabitans suffuscus]